MTEPMTTQSAGAHGLPELPKLPDYFEDFMDRTRQEVHAYATAHGLACYEAGLAAAAQAVPEGFVLVPREPTDAMVDAGFNCVNYGTTVQSDIERAWSSMLDAAPTQGAEGAAPQAVVGEASAVRCSLCCGTKLVQDGQLLGDGGAAFDEPIKCFKDCPACAVSATPTPPLAGTRYEINIHANHLRAYIDSLRGEAFQGAIHSLGSLREIIEGLLACAALTPSPTPTAPQEADALREALAELVALKDMKERIELIRAGHTFMTDAQDEADSLEQEYGARKPLAWAAARAALAQHQPQQGERQ